MHADVNCAGGEEKLFITDGVAWAMISMMEGAGARALAGGRRRHNRGLCNKLSGGKLTAL